MAITLIAHTHTTGTTASPAIDTTGANCLVVAVSDFSHDSSTDTISDSKGNSWGSASVISVFDNAGSGYSVAIFVLPNAIVGTGHTFTVTNGATSGVAVAAFSGVATSSAFDQSNTNHVTNVQTIQPGSVTPSVNGELLLTACGSAGGNDIDPFTIDSSFSVADHVLWVSSTNMSCNLGYLVQGTAAAVNPTWTYANNNAGGVAVIASFKAAAGGDIVTEQNQWQVKIG